MKKKIDEKALSVVDPSVTEMFMHTDFTPSKKVMSFMPSFFTTASLPFKNIHKNVFIRKGSNGITLTLTSPKNVPFGKYGRLLLSVLTTHAVLSPEKDVPVLIEYASLGELLRELQLPKQRGMDIREQLACFSNAAFTFDHKVTESKAGYLFKDMYKDGDYPKEDVEVTTYTTGNIRFTNGIQYEEVSAGSGENSYGHYKIMLSGEFVKLCQEHAVPIDYTVYKDISSPVGKDIYAWLVYRNNGIDPKKEPPFIPRQKLVEQFMPVSETVENKSKAESNNYAKIIELVKEIKEKYYPELKVNIDSQGLGITLYKSPTPVLKNDTRYALITSEL